MVCPAARSKNSDSKFKFLQREKLYFNFATSNVINNNLLEHNRFLNYYLSQEGEWFLSTGVTVSNVRKYNFVKRFLNPLIRKHQRETSLRIKQEQ